MLRSSSSSERRHRAGRARAAWALFVLGLVTAGPSVVGAVPVQGVDEILHWRGDVVLASTVLVPPGSTLVVAPGTSVRPMPGAFVEVVVHGRLDARGDAGAPIHLAVPVRLVGPGTAGSRSEHALLEPAGDSESCGLSLEEASLTARDLTVRGWGTGLCVASASAPLPIVPAEPPLPEAASTAPVPMLTSAIVGANPTGPPGLRDAPDEPLARLSSGPRPSLLLDEARFEANGVGLRLGEHATDVRLANVSFVDNDVGVEARGGEAVLDHARFAGNRVWDIDSTGSPWAVQWYGASVEPSCMNVGGSPAGACERGVVPRAPLVALLALMVLFWHAVTYWGTRLVVVVRLFGRIERKDLLDHPLRAQVHALVAEEPGIHLRELARRLGAYGTIVYHVNRLELGGLLRSEPAGVYRRLYPRGEVDAEPAVRHPRERLLAFVQGSPGVRPSHAAHRLGLSRQLVEHHVQHLEEEGLVARVCRGARTFLFALPGEGRDRR